jgi:hypothetical protein
MQREYNPISKASEACHFTAESAIFKPLHARIHHSNHVETVFREYLRYVTVTKTKPHGYWVYSGDCSSHCKITCAFLLWMHRYYTLNSVLTMIQPVIRYRQRVNGFAGVVRQTPLWSRRNHMHTSLSHRALLSFLRAIRIPPSEQPSKLSCCNPLCCSRTPYQHLRPGIRIW